MKKLEQYGVIDIIFQTNLPQITFLTERLPDGYLKIRPEIYQNRKKIELDKLQAIINYLSTSQCRSEMIGQYFESDMGKCGICDVCKSEKNSNHTFKELIELIPTLLPAKSSEISHQLQIDNTLTQQVLHKLILEELVLFNEGQYKLINS